MRHANLTELLQFLDNLCAGACHKMFFRTGYYLCRVLCDADRSQIGQLDFRRIPSYLLTMLLKNGDFMGILFNGAGIEVVPIGIARHYAEGALLTTPADEERRVTIDGGLLSVLYGGLWSSFHTIAVIPKNSQASRQNLYEGLNSGSSMFFLHS